MDTHVYLNEQQACSLVKAALDLAGIRAARCGGKPAVIQPVEGARLLAGPLGRIEGGHRRGLRHLGCDTAARRCG